jgi:hypothetical protein
MLFQQVFYKQKRKIKSTTFYHVALNSNPFPILKPEYGRLVPRAMIFEQ